jgi:alpha-D-ribose 1-methylphosphonate 5-triphosphate diphosphatase PhnM
MLQYDSTGRLVSYAVFLPRSLLRTMRTLVLAHGWALPEALQLVTSNPAHFLGMPTTGIWNPQCVGRL